MATIPLVLLTAVVLGSAQRPAQPGAPSYSRLLGVVVGIDTTHRLERLIGKGEVAVGGHSNSARHWSFGALDIRSDAFDRRGNELILDTIEFSGWKGELRSCRPFSRLGSGPFGSLRVGMTAEQCMKALHGVRLSRSAKRVLSRNDRRLIRPPGGAKGLYQYQLELLLDPQQRLAEVIVIGQRVSEAAGP